MTRSSTRFTSARSGSRVRSSRPAPASASAWKEQRNRGPKEVQLMKKKMLFAAALTAGLITIAAAQDSRLPQASLDREINVPRAAGTAASDRPAQSQTPPTFCKPCLFYAGDFDSTASDANGLANEVDVIVSTGAATYTP